MEAIEYEEPIYELAVECERLFVQHVSRLNDDDQPNGAKILSELSQRFAAWTAFLGVFAESNVCLDRRLRRHVEIQDQVLLFERDDPPDCMDTGSSDACQSSLQPFCVSIYSLDAISGAIERLNHLGLSIRQSSVTSQTSKARKFAEKLDLASFEGVAYLSVKTLYPEASEDLLEQLTRSMTETFSLFLRRKYRQEQLQAPRSHLRTAIPLSTIIEEPVGDDDVGSPMDTQIQVRQLGEDFTTKMLRRSAHMLPISEPTSVDSQGFRTRFKKMLSPAVNDKTMSILVNQVDYPQPAKGSLTCEWCFSPLPADSFEGAKWRDEDTTFSGPKDLTKHLDNLHAGTFTVSQVEAIVQQSRFRSPRVQDICPLCCLPVKGPQDTLSKETGNEIRDPSPEQQHYEASRLDESKQIKTETGHTYLDHNNGINLETKTKHREPKALFGPSTSRPTSLEVIASHVAAHLQGIMLLTLRLISIDIAMDVSADDQSASDGADHQSSLVISSERSVYQNMDNIEDFSLHRDGGIDPDNDPPLEHVVPDCEHIDWRVVPRRYEAPPEPDLKDITHDGDASGRELEEFLSNHPTGKPRDKDYLGQDLEEFISNPPMGAPRDQDYLGWDLEAFISNPPTRGPWDKDNLGQDLEEFISKPPV
ncbi:uncharacterized protein N7482_006892 [Penicillium canariense]|uniref:Uncharacterized protein n=1 Tax=Penicillium canariense TaxID=189055 RepID=A0A9W9LJT2_9EURO|nr:uncharacterized protein N7482_006892 [Penicillium canariense]KAJ5159888.1 hypothetical protein N7482_006892 [Penicillium canariense]